MEIKTKFNVNDEVYFLEDNEITKNTIIRINVQVSRAVKEHIDIYYDMDISMNDQRIHEDYVSKTKKELLEKLMIKSEENK